MNYQYKNEVERLQKQNLPKADTNMVDFLEIFPKFNGKKFLRITMNEMLRYLLMINTHYNFLILRLPRISCKAYFSLLY